MKPILEYILNKGTKVKSIIHATNDTVWNIVYNEVEKLGYNANLNHIDMSEVTTFVFFNNNSHTPFETFTESDLYDNWTPLRFGEKYGFFNGDISEWDVSNVKYMCSLFDGCDSFNCDISRWNVSSCRYTAFMFNDATRFDQDLSKWKLHNIEFDTDMFNNCGISQKNLPKIYQ